MSRAERAELWADVKPLAQLLAPFVLLVVVLAVNVLTHQQGPPAEQDIYVAPVVTTTPATAPPVELTTTTTAARSTTTVAASSSVSAGVWDLLADCESGAWDRNGVPIPGTADWADDDPPYEGGVHFAPSTWDAHRPDGYPDAAYLATREQQIVVAERVLAAQGWARAWPTCSKKIGAR